MKIWKKLNTSLCSLKFNRILGSCNHQVSSFLTKITFYKETNVKTLILSSLFSLLLPLSAMANNLALPESTSALTLKLEALATCNFTGMNGEITETADEIQVYIEVTEFTKKGCFDKRQVSDSVKIKLSSKQANSGKNIVIKSDDQSVNLVGVDFNN